MQASHPLPWHWLVTSHNPPWRILSIPPNVSVGTWGFTWDFELRAFCIGYLAC